MRAAAHLEHDDLESHRRALLECERRGGDVLALCADLAARGWWWPVVERAERLLAASVERHEERHRVRHVDTHTIIVDLEPTLAPVAAEPVPVHTELRIGDGSGIRAGDEVIVGHVERVHPELAREAANTVRLLAPYAAGECAGSYPPCECPVCYPRTQRSDDPGPPIPMRAVERLYLRAVDVWWPQHGREWRHLTFPVDDG